MRTVWRIPLVSGLVFFLLAGPAVSQSRTEQEKRDQMRQEEISDYYAKWLEQDVVYIINDEEKAVFEALTTNEEKDAFIEQFWLRRDPDPRTAENEFRAEHYRRIAYANERFSVGLPGWKSDRGRVYIINGPPDEIEVHDQGEQYYRSTDEGGGVTTTYAWQVWYYRHIEGVGDGIEVEFVDRRMTGDFRLAFDEMDRDAMLWSPGLGLTESERLGGARRSERIGTRTMANMASRRGGNPLKVFTRNDELFDRLHRYTQLQTPPAIRYKDLEALTDIELYYNNLPFSVRHHLIRITEQDYLVPVTFFFDMEQFGLTSVAQSRRLELNVYGRIEDMTKRHVYSFDDDVVVFSDPEQRTNQAGLFQRAVPLKPGRYKLVAVVKEKSGGQLGSLTQGIIVPKASTTPDLELSQLVLASLVQPAGREEFINDPFVLGTVKVYPSPGNEFRRGKPLGFYFEIYNVAADQQTLEPSLDLELEIRADGKLIPLPVRDLHRLIHRYSDRFFAGSMLSTQPLSPGRYTLTVRVTDRIAGRTVHQTVPFRIVEDARVGSDD